MLDEPGFRLTSSRLEKQLTRDLIRFDFEYNPPEKGRAPMWGWWAVDPKLGWSVQEFEIRSNAANRVTRGSISYRALHSTAYVPRTVEVDYTTSNLTWAYQFVFDAYTYDDSPDRDFDPSSFGLEMANDGYGAQSGNRAESALLCIAFAALLTAIILKRAISRRMHAAAA